MKQFVIRRVLPVLLVISLSIPSFSVSVFAADNLMYDDAAVSQWNSVLNNPNSAFIESLGSLFFGVSVSAEKTFWRFVDGVLERKVGELSFDELVLLCNRLNSTFNADPSDLFTYFTSAYNKSIASLFGIGTCRFEIVDLPSGISCIYESKRNLLVVDSTGAFPYAWWDENDVDTSGGNQWVDATTVHMNIIKEVDPRVKIVIADVLDVTQSRLYDSGVDCWITELGNSKYKVITKPGYYYCDENGFPIVCPVDSYHVAINQDRPTSEIVDSGGNQLEVPEDMEVSIDLENQFVLLPSGGTEITGEIIYDTSSRVYSVESYDIVKNEIHNYTYEYYVQNTTVTYIGETMDYEKYECYYKLPDGRSSADLTKEELEQLNVGIDVVEYSRSTDDVRLRALYHFDGDTKDSSYWNHLSNFEWSNNASITYMDVETFGGALYFDPNVYYTMHMRLPTALGAGDWTIQFRYYQGQATGEDNTSGLYLNATPQDNAKWNPNIDANAIRVMGFDGTNMIDLPDEDGETRHREYSIGSWNEFCLTCEDGRLTYFINGMPVMSTTDLDGTLYNDYLTFAFSGKSGAYVMFDELRVLNYAIASGTGSYYEPTAVPHDTNLALVLPEDKIAIADEYWTFESSHENLLEQYGLADWQGFGYKDMSPYLVPLDTHFELNEEGRVVGDSFSQQSWPGMFYQSEAYSLSPGSSGVKLEPLYPEWIEKGVDCGMFDSNFKPFMSLCIPLAGLPDGTYTVSVCTNIDRIFTVTFGLTDGLPDSWYKSAYGYSGIYIDKSFPYITIYENDGWVDWELLYVELVEGSSTDLTATYNGEIAIVDKDDQFKPTLAVKTDLEITDYQIGGVRPSIPSKGLVYAMVESGYITSLQIYNGQAWEACDGRIWTGQRWIPYSSYNVITLQDMYDVVDATPGYEYIYSESGFWAWWQKSWNEFKEQLFSILNNIAGNVGEDSGLDGVIVIVDPEKEGELSLLDFFKLLFDGGKSVIQGVRDLFSGAVSSVPDAVETITSAFGEGGIAVGLIDGTYRDPDMEVVAVMDLDSLDYYETEEVLDPWRYR